jgi:hypothetical protein
MTKPAGALAVVATLGSVVLAVGCIDDQSSSTTDEGEQVLQDVTTSCPLAAGTYTPYSAAPEPTGTAASLVWRGATAMYPNGIEDFSGYKLPSTVECSSNKSLRNYLDVTSGCLNAVAVGAYARGQVSGDIFRVVAMGHNSQGVGPVKWTDQSVQYRFYYSGTTNSINYPGFKVFARYNSEDDLYVASWRTDGVAQIQKKQCGSYTALKIVKTYGAPTTKTWHTIRFDVIGNQLSLYLDGKLAVTAQDTTFASGTAGIRIDSMNGAYIDDWSVR